MNRYFFHFSEGRHAVEDRVGMYLPDLEAAKAEAARTLLDIIALAGNVSELPNYSVLIANAHHEVLLTVRHGPAGDIQVETNAPGAHARGRGK